MALIDCPECGHKVDETSLQCHYCGWRRVEQATTDCPDCGHRVLRSVKTCPYCGVDLSKQTTDRNRVVQAGQQQRQVELDLALAKIDLEWERERPKYMFNKGVFVGGQVIPTKAGALRSGILVGIWGIGTAIIIVLVDREYGLMLGGFVAVVFLLASILGATWAYRKAVEWERAEAEYQRRREKVKAKCEKRDKDRPSESSPPSG